MQDLSSVQLKRLEGRLGELVVELTRVQFSRFTPPEMWRPAVNAYLCESEFAICVDLAGVDREKIEVTVEPRRVHLRGRREAPEPDPGQHKPLQILALEIDYGRFERRLELPAAVEPVRVRAEQRNGLLWIYLPLASAS